MGDGGSDPTMDLLRSEPMQLAQLIIPIESAYRAVSCLGDLGLFQFKDLNAEKNPFQRTYAAQKLGDITEMRAFLQRISLQNALTKCN